jgi:outer membrane protein OmpA-like peptidoglycan-associated protein
MADISSPARRLGSALAGCILCLSGEAAAQGTIVIGRAEPSVIVDLGVLDALGPAPTLPALLKRRPAERVSLRPPSIPARPAARAATGGPQPAASVPSAPAASATPLASVPAPLPAAASPPAPAAAPPAAPAPAAPAAAAPPPPPAPAPAPVAAAPTPPRAAAPSPPATTPPAPAAARVAAVPPPATQAPAAAPPQPQTAARTPPGTATPPGSGARLVFQPGSADLPAGGETTLKELAQKLNVDESLRLQVVAYADGTPEQASQARRLSLSRALTVRSYLIGQGVRSTRIDVRALGSRAGDGPADRVDLLIGDR